MGPSSYLSIYQSKTMNMYLIYWDQHYVYYIKPCLQNIASMSSVGKHWQSISQTCIKFCSHIIIYSTHNKLIDKFLSATITICVKNVGSIFLLEVAATQN